MAHFKNYISKLFLLFALISCSLKAQEGSAQNWPKDIISGDYTITIYQPESLSYIDNKLESNMAFAVKEKDKDPVFGMIWATSLLDVDRNSRQASLASVKIEEIRLPYEMTTDQKVKLQNLVNGEIPKWNIEFSIDELINNLEEVSVTTSALNNAPPKILFANEPSALILIDGEPKLKEIEKGYDLVENTGAFIIYVKKEKRYYLKGGDFWYQSSNPLGPWIQTQKAPSKVRNIAKKAESQNNEESTDDAYSGSAPKIVVVTEPSELIVFDGEPKYSPIQNTNLLYVENTESNIFMHVGSQTYYVLLSGRWFTTKNVKGPWNYVAAEKLPNDFKNISSDSKKADILSNVPGTKEAKDAIYDAQIPQTAAVERDTKATTVEYNGSPEFQNIKNLNLQYAVNTESAVFKDNQTYYLCDNAIWFKSNSPNGPWQVADERPNEVEKIPAENPRYNTKYVYIYETSPTRVYVGYTPGYYGCYVYGPTIVYGTGFYYNPWYRGHYYHYHYSYGFSVRYNPWYGWSFGFGFGSPFFWYGYSYWGWGFHHWGPPFYRPPYYRPGRRPRPSHPIYRNRRGVSHYNRPVTRPNTPATRPSTRPNVPTTRPETRPNVPATTPETRPNVPTTTPETRPNVPTTTPETRPNVPTTRPSTPTTRPTTPTTRPNVPNTRPTFPNTRPSTRPSMPSTRPAPRPMSRPSAMPSSRPASRPSVRR
ncbi:hypothetical protein VOI54_10125 [Tamlana sp. 2201CG12-4]|uniref:hypothetical protein n=1 Tax=Tamlana sp. 2201CG12-4 TaxID=3112582 RepID=UPI002DBC4903|nr:hypothetical protein [Tamlana sp. 2201CG12-4]MEC3907375.1 hypothetical protein [Tamlana sp. 2201CG12-4]